MDPALAKANPCVGVSVSACWIWEAQARAGIRDRAGVRVEKLVHVVHSEKMSMLLKVITLLLILIRGILSTAAAAAFLLRERYRLG